MLHIDSTDEELMASYQSGSSEAFKILYVRHSGKILGYLRSRTAFEAEAADLFQEVFVKIHKSKHLYNRSLPVLPWIFSVTHSVLVDAKRKNARKREVHDFDFDRMATEEAESPSDFASVAPLMKALPDRQQVALEMRYVDEKTFEEIAERLKTSPLNVRQMISRGVRRLKEIAKKGEQG